MTLNMCWLFESFIEGTKSFGDTQEQIFNHLNLIFIFSLAWTFASAFQDKESEKIDAFIKKKFNNIEFP